MSSVTEWWSPHEKHLINLSDHLCIVCRRIIQYLINPNPKQDAFQFIKLFAEWIATNQAKNTNIFKFNTLSRKQFAKYLADEQKKYIPGEKSVIISDLTSACKEGSCVQKDIWLVRGQTRPSSEKIHFAFRLDWITVLDLSLWRLPVYRWQTSDIIPSLILDQDDSFLCRWSATTFSHVDHSMVNDGFTKERSWSGWVDKDIIYCAPTGVSSPQMTLTK